MVDVAMDDWDVALLGGLRTAAPEDSLAGWRKLATKYPSEPSFKLGYSHALLLDDQRQEAREVAEQALEQVGRTGAVLAQLALLAHADGDDGEAMQLSSQAIDAGEESPWLLEMRGAVLEGRGERDAAAAAFLSAYRSDPSRWQRLKRYCELTDRPYTAPGDDPVPVSPLSRQWLYRFVGDTTGPARPDRELTASEHDFRVVQAWCEVSGRDPIALYQWLNDQSASSDYDVVRVSDSDDESANFSVVGGSLGSAPTLRQAFDDLDGVVELAEDKRAEVAPGESPRSRSDLHFITEPDEAIEIPPQDLWGSAWGVAATAIGHMADAGLSFWVVAAGEGSTPPWAWAILEGKFHEWCLEDDQIPKDIPVRLREPIEQGLATLRAAGVGPGADCWTERMPTLPPREGVPRVMFGGEGFVVRMAYADGSSPGPQAMGQFFRPSASPDGRRLAYVEITAAGQSVVLADTQTGVRRRVFSAPCVETSTLYWIDDEHILLPEQAANIDGNTKSFPWADAVSRDGRRYLVSDDGTEVFDRDGTLVASCEFSSMLLSWSPDGERIAFVRLGSPQHKLVLWDLSDPPTTLNIPDASCYWPSFTHDGQAIVFQHTAEEIRRIARYDLGTGLLSFLSDGPHDECPVAHPSSPWVAWQRRDPDNRERTSLCTYGPDGVVVVHAGEGSSPVWWPT